MLRRFAEKYSIEQKDIEFQTYSCKHGNGLSDKVHCLAFLVPWDASRTDQSTCNLHLFRLKNSSLLFPTTVRQQVSINYPFVNFEFIFVSFFIIQLRLSEHDIQGRVMRKDVAPNIVYKHRVSTISQIFGLHLEYSSAAILLSRKMIRLRYFGSQNLTTDAKTSLL